MRAWIGLALLSASWLFGLGYYYPANWPAWMVIAVLGTILLASRPTRPLAGRELAAATAMLLPAVWFLPWPYRAAPVWIAVGLALQRAPGPRRWPQALGWGAVQAGVVQLGQALAVLAYAVHTARCHDLPWPLPGLLGWVASLLGIDAAVHGKTVTMHSLREVYARAAIHRLPATWGMLLDPATLCFFVGGLILLGIMAWNGLPEGTRWSRWVRSARVFALVVAAWLPLRAGLLMSLYLDRVLRANPTVPPTVMSQFFSPWVCLALLAGPVLLAWWFLRTWSEELRQAVVGGESRVVSGERRELPPASCPLPTAYCPLPTATSPGLPARLGRWQYPAALGLVACAMAVFSWAVEWDPVGRRKAGRVMVVERHSTWEPTNRPYDKQHFGHDPSYSYTRIYDYCSQFYQMSRLLESDPISREKLGECDVLVVKIPTARFSAKEVQAITEFVEAGGGLLLIGDHTNVFRSTTYLNEITRPFGFTFRHDLLFRFGSPYDQELRRPAVPHPIAQHLPPMYYAVSCSIDPGASWGRAAVLSTGLWNLPPDYHADNYHPPAEYQAEMCYGAFTQLWAVRHGSGRVLAFTDSTIFSNFCIFQPGKAELMVGMLEWLNHSSALDRAWVRWSVVIAAFLVALGSLAAGLVLARGSQAAWITLIAAGVLGLTAGSMAVAAVHRRTMPEPGLLRPPMTRVVIDRTVSEVLLSLGAFPQGDGQGYGLLEQWIARLGYCTQRCSGREAFSGEALVVLCPTRSVTEEFRQGLAEYVAGGGKVLIVDSPDVVGSTANSLLWPFQMAIEHAASQKGRLRLTDDWPPEIELPTACAVVGGKPVMWVGEVPVAARTNYGKGSVMAIGFGSLFNDTGMGMYWTEDPDAQLLTRFDVLFALVEALVEDRPVVAPPPRRSESTE